MVPKDRIDQATALAPDLGVDTGIIFPLRAGDKIKSHFWLFTRSPSKARGGRIAGYLTDEQRGGVRCMDDQKCDFILSPALSLGG